MRAVLGALEPVAVLCTVLLGLVGTAAGLALASIPAILLFMLFIQF